MATFRQTRPKINYLHVWVVKAGNRKKIADLCNKHLTGLKFDCIYTLDSRLCMETVNEICLTLELKEVEIVLTERFLHKKNAIECWEIFRGEKTFKESVVTWQKGNPREFKEMINTIKANLQSTVKGLAKKFESRLAFTVLIVVDDSAPVFEILGLPANNQLKMMLAGELTRLRFEIKTDETYESSRIIPKMATQPT